MSIPKLLISYLLTFVVFLVVDMAWLGLIAKNLYKKYLGDLLSDQVNWIVAMLFYLLFVVGIFIFVVLPAVEKDSLRSAVLMGALFGFFTYATYDLTNLATLKNWPAVLTVIDISWGAVLTSVVSVAGFYIVRYFQ